MSMFKKASLLLMALTLSASAALAGCSKESSGGGASPDKTGAATKESEGNSAGGFVFGETPIEFSFYGNYDWYTMNPWGGRSGYRLD